MDEGEVGQSMGFGDLDGELAGVDELDDLGELAGGVAGDEVDGCDLRTSRRLDRCGDRDDDTAWPDERNKVGGRRRRDRG